MKYIRILSHKSFRILFKYKYRYFLGELFPSYTKRGRQSSLEASSRICPKNWSHFARHIPPTNKKSHPTRPCKVCAKNKKRKETTWECEFCHVALHVPECFKIYHTVLDFKV